MSSVTLVAVGSETVENRVIFAKNVNGHPNSLCKLVFQPTRNYYSEEQLPLQFTKIPQEDHTNAILFYQTQTVYGTEVGSNEYGVTIGNERVSSQAPQHFNSSPNFLYITSLTG